MEGHSTASRRASLYGLDTAEASPSLLPVAFKKRRKAMTKHSFELDHVDLVTLVVLMRGYIRANRSNLDAQQLADLERLRELLEREADMAF